MFEIILPTFHFLSKNKPVDLISCLLQNNLRGGEMVFEIQRTFRHRKGYSVTTTLTSTLFLFYHGNKIELQRKLFPVAPL